MASRVWQAGVVVAVMGLSGCASGGGSVPTLPSSSSSSGSESLVGPEWSLRSLGGKAVVAGTSLTATFSAEGQVSGTSGCNRYFGRATAESGRLSVGPLGSTMMACPQDAMDQEQAYLAALQAAASYAIEGGELRLSPAAGQPTLVFASR